MLASETATLNYMLRAVAPPFEAERLTLPRLADLRTGEGSAEAADEAHWPPVRADASAVDLLESLFRLPSPDVFRTRGEDAGGPA